MKAVSHNQRNGGHRKSLGLGTSRDLVSPGKAKGNQGKVSLSLRKATLSLEMKGSGKARSCHWIVVVMVTAD